MVIRLNDCKNGFGLSIKSSGVKLLRNKRRRHRKCVNMHACVSIWFVQYIVCFQASVPPTPVPEATATNSSPMAVHAKYVVCLCMHACTCRRILLTHLYHDQQKYFWVPNSIRDMWNGPVKFSMKNALFRLNITPEKFHGYWEAKVQSCENSESGKKELLGLLEKAGLRLCGNKYQRLKKQLWFAKQIIGHKAPDPEATIARSVRSYVCMYASAWDP